jgi:hypothetical protein
MCRSRWLIGNRFGSESGVPFGSGTSKRAYFVVDPSIIEVYRYVRGFAIEI